MHTSIDNLGKILGKESTDLPRINVTEYDENVPAYLREKFYHDYPLLKRVYDFAVENNRKIEAV